MTSALPYLLVEVLANDKALLLSSPLDLRIVSLQTGSLLASLKWASVDEAARKGVSVDVAEVASSSDASSFDALVALVGDDKRLSVFRIRGSADGDAQPTTIKRVWTQVLPKRVVKMVWEPEWGQESHAKRLVIGDRHGDVRSFVVPITDVALAEPASKPDQEAAASAKEAQPSGDAAETTQQQTTQMEDDEEAGTLHLGHVSFLTDYVLSSFTVPYSDSEKSADPEPARFIITSDRDEHIRVSRWGPHRKGHVALRYLLGSQLAVGAICAVEGEELQCLQSATEQLSQAGQDISRFAFLLSSDGGTIRIWSLHPDGQVGRADSLASFDVKEAVRPYYVVTAEKERKRNQMHAKGKGKLKRTAEGDNAEGQEQAQTQAQTQAQAPQEVVPRFTPFMTRFQTFVGPDRKAYLIFTVDGANALFSVSLAALISSTSSEEASKHIKAVDVGLPVLDYALHVSTGSEGPVDVWILGDVREEVVADVSTRLPLSLVRWNATDAVFKKVDVESNGVLQNQHATLAINDADQGLASSLILYEALSLLNKQEFEKTASRDIFSDGGLIKGGMANHEIPGRAAKRTNKQHGEWATRRRERARAAMRKRIEETLGGSIG